MEDLLALFQILDYSVENCGAADRLTWVCTFNFGSKDGLSPNRQVWETRRNPRQRDQLGDIIM